MSLQTLRHIKKGGTKPYTVPPHAPDSAFVECYRWDIQRQPLLLFGLRRDDGTPYLPQQGRGKVFTSGIVVSDLQGVI